MIKIKYCKKCNNYHPESFFDKNSNKTGLRTSCSLYRLRKNRDKILTLVNTKLNYNDYWYNQLLVIIDLYSVGVQYRQFANLFNDDIQKFINYFISIDLKYCANCEQLKSRKYFSKHKKLSDGIMSKCKQCCQEYNNQQYVKNKRNIRNKTEHHKLIDKKYRELHKEERQLYIKKYLKRNALYKTYSKQLLFCETVRKDPNNYKLLQVKCYLQSCRKWFNPTNQQVQKKIYSFSGNAPIGDQNNLYCCEKCKQNCLTYKQKNTLKNTSKNNNRDINYHNQLKIIKLNENFIQYGNYTCEKCHIQLNKKDLTLHHIKPSVIDPIEVYDKDNVILICKKCDTIIHNSINCSISELVKFQNNKSSKC